MCLWLCDKYANGNAMIALNMPDNNNKRLQESNKYSITLTLQLGTNAVIEWVSNGVFNYKTN